MKRIGTRVILRVASCLAAGGVAIGAAAREGGAQQPQAQPPQPRQTATVAGVVRGEGGVEITAVEVAIPGTSLRTQTDEAGAFLLRDVPLGTATLRARRLGFEPREVKTAVTPAGVAGLQIVLTPLPQRLDAVQVVSTKKYSGPLGDFYRRRESGMGGSFFTRAQIDSLRPHTTTDLLRRVPGLDLIPAGGASRGGATSIVRARNSHCLPLVWLDGTPAAAAYFDVDNINPMTIEGIEIYKGVATVPTTLLGPGAEGSCGVIAIWTRQGEPRPKRRDPKKAAAQIAALVDSVQVYTAQQVDVAAALDSAHDFTPDYPYELRRTKTPGMVVAEFVVDTRGRVEPATFNVVQSTHPMFTQAVDEALSGARFVPALLKGHRVRQLVQLPVRFVLP